MRCCAGSWRRPRTVVYLELLRGAQSPADFQALAQTLAVLQYLPVTAERWREAAQLGFALRRQGVNVPSPDLLIAAVAIAQNATLVHRDGDYELIAKHAPWQPRAFCSPVTRVLAAGGPFAAADTSACKSLPP
jgi:predicted nucleic acid-binding protein